MTQHSFSLCFFYKRLKSFCFQFSSNTRRRMPISRAAQLMFLTLVIFKGIKAIDWSNIHEIDGDFYKNSYEIQDVKSTHELDAFMSEISDYFYFNDNGIYTHQYKQSVQKIAIKQGSTLSLIPTKVFEKFANLAEFSAVDVFFEEINRDDFESAKSLFYLTLQSNQIKRLDNMVFMHCKKLVEVDLSSNEISYIHDNAFEGMSSSIKKIDLSNNKIAFLKEDSLILLLKGVAFSNEDITLNFTGNQIEEVVPSNQTVAKAFPLVYLALIKNKLKAFECTALKFSFLDLENNEVESLNAETSFQQLDVSNNKLDRLFIRNTVNFVKAVNNKLTNITIEKESQLDTLILSGNKLGNEFLLQLKGLKRLQILELSATNLTELSVDTFAEQDILETLRLDHNSISSIGHGVFAHQTNLINLNISYNALKSIDLHVFGALSSLENIDISRNNISSIEDYESLHQILSKLSTIRLEGNSWSCRLLAKMRNSLKIQNVSIISPQRRVTNITNFDGFACFENSELIAPVESSNVGALAVNSVIEKVNDLNLKSSKSTQELENISSMILQLKKDVLELQSTHLASQLSNSSDITEVRSLFEKMINVTLEKQKLAYDQLLRKINVEIENLKAEVEKEVSEKNAIDTPGSLTLIQSHSFTRLEIVLIIFFLFTIALLTIFSVQQTRRYVNKKLDQIARHRVSRRNSVSTVVTYDNSNNV